MYELLVKGGTVIAPAQQIHNQMDAGISDGKIAALERDIASSEASISLSVLGNQFPSQPYLRLSGRPATGCRRIYLGQPKSLSQGCPESGYA